MKKNNISTFPGNSGGGSGFDIPSGGDNFGGMEARVAKLESDVGNIKTNIEDIKKDIREFRTEIKDVRKDMQLDFRILFGSLIFAVLGLAGMMAKGFGWIK